MKAIEKDRGRRYDTASALAEDVSRYLADDLVSARPPSTWYRCQKLARRYKHFAAAIAIALLSVVLGLMATTIAWLDAADARDVADRVLIDVTAAKAEAVSQRERAEQTSDELQRELYIATLGSVQNALDNDFHNLARTLLQRSPEGIRLWEWQWLSERTRPGPLFSRRNFFLVPQFGQHERIACLARDRQSFSIWDSSTGKLVSEFKNPLKDSMLWTMSHDMSKVVAHDFETLTLLDVATGNVVWERELVYRPHWEPPVFSPDDTRIYTYNRYYVVVRDASDGGGRKAANVREGVGRGLKISLDGTRLVFAYKVLDARTLEPLSLMNANGLTNGGAIAISPDNRTILTGDSDGKVRLWDVASGEIVRTYQGHRGTIHDVEFSPHGLQFASGGMDTTVRVGRLDGSTYYLTTVGNHTGSVNHIAYRLDGQRIAAVGRGLHIWGADPYHSSGICDIESRYGGTQSVVFSPDSRQIASACRDSTLRIWDADSGQEQMSIQRSDVIHELAHHPIEPWVATVGRKEHDLEVQIWDTRDGKEQCRWSIPGGHVVGISFSPSGEFVAVGVRGYVRLWRVPSAELVFHREAAGRYCFPPDGNEIGLEEDKSTVFYDVLTGEVSRSVASPYGVSALSCDGESFLCFAKDVVQLIDIKSGEPLCNLDEHLKIGGMVFDPKDERIWAFNERGIVSFDSDSGRHLLSCEFQSPTSIAISPDGRSVAAGSADGRIRMWTLDSHLVNQEMRETVTNARRIVHERFEKHVFAHDAIESIETDNELNRRIRSTAIDIAKVHGDNAYQLNRESWNTSITVNRDMEEYRLALRKAKTCCDQFPESTEFRSTLGICQYRVGRFADALQTLNAAHASTPPISDRFVVELAFIAMCHHRLGFNHKAVARIEELRSLLQADRWQGRGDLQALFEQAETTVLSVSSSAS